MNNLRLQPSIQGASDKFQVIFVVKIWKTTRLAAAREVRMKILKKAALFLAGTCAAVVMLCAAVPALSEVNVSVNIGPPAIVVREPEMIVVPRTMVYFAPGVEAELYFYRGRWWSRNEGRWFRAKSYNGPWSAVGPRYVPVEIVRLPRDYRTVYVREQRVPYGQLKKHWTRRDDERRRRVGEWKEEKRERKVEQRERRMEEREHGDRGHDR